jgi:hypothetical protein
MKLIKDLTQKHLEDYEMYFNEATAVTVLGQSRGHGIQVRSAIQAGWFNGANLDEVDSMKPQDVRKLSRQVVTRYQEVTADPPNET